MEIDGNGNPSRFFRPGGPPVTYFSQFNAWYDWDTFRKWFGEIFLHFVSRYTSRPVELVMNDCGPHGTDV